jgi:hypothetical protein
MVFKTKVTSGRVPFRVRTTWDQQRASTKVKVYQESCQDSQELIREYGKRYYKIVHIDNAKEIFQWQYLIVLD